MKINPGAGNPYANQRTEAGNPAPVRNGHHESFSSVLGATRIDQSPTQSASVERINFNSMTRQEMRDWVNGQIRSGKMSLDESSPLMAMTMQISVATGQPTDSATDTTPIDFVEKARQGVEGALSRNDAEAAKRLQLAIEIMLKRQGEVIGVDARA